MWKYNEPYNFMDNSFCYDGKIKENLPISTNGYYEMEYVYNDNSKFNDVVLDIIFFEDGLFYTDVYVTKPNKTTEYIDSIINIKDDSKINFGGWGYYIIKENTITAKYLYSSMSSVASERGGVIYEYKIINKNTLEVIHLKTFDNTTNIYFNDNDKHVPVAKFVSAHIPKKPIPWLKEKWWFWCDKEDWQQFMDSVKQK